MFGYEENHKERNHATRYVTFRKKERVARKKPENSDVARVFATPKATAELLRLSSGRVSPPRKSLPVLRTTIVRRPRESIPVVFTKKGTDPTEGHREMEVRRQARPILRKKTEVEDTPSQLEITAINREDARINTASLRRFALEKLPKESVLRQVILAEKEELTPEEFIARIEIWSRLLNQ